MAGNQKIITDLIFNIAASTAELRAGINNANNQLSSFANKVKGLAAGFGVAFGVQEVLNFGLEVSKLAGEAEGVENAFKKLAGSTQLLEDMKRATQGTVSELELMKRAVQFSNFGLDLGQLPKLLEFATKRAAQTGQSVDYLVDSIVTGLGRKSVLILDNLGISSQQLNAEIAKTGDFFKSVGTIVDQSLGQMGDLIENNATKLQRLSATYENLKVSIGNAANGTGLLGRAVDEVNDYMTVAASDKIPLWVKAITLTTPGVKDLALQLDQLKTKMDLSKEAQKTAQITREVDRAFVEFGGNIEAYAKAIETHIYKQELLAEFTKRLSNAETKRAKSIENITNLQARQSELQQLQLIQTGQQLAATNVELKQIDEKIKKLKELGLAEQQLHNITKVPDTIQKYLDNRKTANSGAKKATFGEGVGGSPDSNELAKKNFQELNDLIDEQDGKVIKLQGSYSSMGATMDDALANIGVDAVESLGNAFAETASGSKNAFQNMVGAILGSIRQLLVALFAKAIAGVVSGAATSVSFPPAAIALAIAGISAMSALWSKIPAFASGGNYGGGMALVGERGPELINFNRGGYVSNASDTARLFGSAGGGLDITINGMVRGEDIYYSLGEVRRKRGLA